MLKERSERLFRILPLEERTVGTLADPAPEHVEIGFKPNRYARFGNPRSGLFIHEGAAAGGQNARTLVQKTGHDAAFPVAEIRLSMPHENFRNRHAGRGFDFGICIDEGKIEHLRQPAAIGGLARAHEPDEDDRTVPQGLHQLSGAPVRRVLRLPICS